MSLSTPENIQKLQRKLYLKAKRELAHAFRKNLVREPDAGKPHVRFDEREVETGHGLRPFGTGDAKGLATESP